jgi:hypothetical protein
MRKLKGQFCPPGFFCMSDTIVIVLFVCIIFGFVALYMFKYSPTSPPQRKTIVQIPSQQPSVISVDNKYMRAPQPLRDWMAPPEIPPRGGIASIPVNIPTKGLPESFQSIGIIKTSSDVLPLYGRRTAGSSDRWNYYTRTNSYNPVPIPIIYGKKDCMDDIGCSELLSGERIKLDDIHDSGTVKIYNYDGPKYIPGLL